LDENTTIGSIQFNNLSSYTIAPGTTGYSLTLDNAGSPANITVTNGSHTISAPINLKSPGLNTAIASGDVLTLAGKITGPAPLSIAGPGTLKFGTNIGEVDLTGLTITNTGTLDINNNHIILNYTGNPDPIATIAGYLKTGYSNGNWTGPGIDSSAAATNKTHYAIGYADGADHVVTGLSSGQIEIAYTLQGDANLDGVVSGDDFTILTDNLGKQVTGWDKGDFNYDGVVSGDDFTLLTDNLGKQTNGADITLPAADYAAVDAFAAAHGLAAPTFPVPEPASFAIVLAGCAGFLARRRR
jgi:hypothetical protein